MNKLLTLLLLNIYSLVQQANTAFTDEKGKDIPKLQNPFWESYIRETLKQTNPRLICDDEGYASVREKRFQKIKTLGLVDENWQVFYNGKATKIKF